jgi:hypothetical protein
VPSAQNLCEFAFSLHLLLDVIHVTEILSQRAIHVAQADRGDVGHDLVRSYGLVFMPHNDVKHTNAVTGDAGFAATNTKATS